MRFNFFSVGLALSNRFRLGAGGKGAAPLTLQPSLLLFASDCGLTPCSGASRSPLAICSLVTGLRLIGCCRCFVVLKRRANYTPVNSRVNTSVNNFFHQTKKNPHMAGGCWSGVGLRATGQAFAFFVDWSIVLDNL